MITQFTAMLLVGGLSQRMGLDKATLTVDGKPLWKRQMEILARLNPQAIWISAREAPSWLPPHIEVILDILPSKGPLSGIAAGLNRLEASHLLALAVDLPKMTSEHLRKLTAFAGPALGVIPKNGEYLEPLVAVYPKEAASVAIQSLASGDNSMHSFARRLLQGHLIKEYSLSGSEVDLYLNANRPGDFES